MKSREHFQPIEEVEAAAHDRYLKKKFPEHDMSGVLVNTLLRYEKGRKAMTNLPADLYQEVSLFLVEHCPEEVDGKKVDYTNLSGEELAELLRAFGRQMHHFFTDNNLAYQRHAPEEVVDLVPRAKATSEQWDSWNSTRIRRDGSADLWDVIAETYWLETHESLCQEALLSLGSEGEHLWKALELYIQGQNPKEIGRILHIGTSEARQRVMKAIDSVRRSHDITEAEAIIVPKGGRLRFEKGNLERGDKKLWVNIPLGATGRQVQEMFNVDINTAGRMIKRAKENDGRSWYMPNVGISRAKRQEARQSELEEPASP